MRLQPPMSGWKLAAVVAVAGGLVAGCSNGPSPLTGLPQVNDVTTSATPPTAKPALEVPSLTALLPEGDSIVGSPTDVYTRVARGVLTCWFGAAGPLKSTHIYHAEADPASKGGKSEIEIFRKDPTVPDPRSLRAYRIAILPASSSSTTVEIENLKIDEPLASRLGADVMRWSKSEGGCGDSPVTGGWAAQQVAPAAEPPAKKAKQKH